MIAVNTIRNMKDGIVLFDCSCGIYKTNERFEDWAILLKVKNGKIVGESKVIEK